MKRIARGIVAAALAAALAGCPLVRVPETKVMLLVSGDVSAGPSSATQLGVVAKAGPVEVDDIESLVVTVTRVAFDRSAGGEAEVFAGEADIDLLSLQGVSEILTTTDLEPGLYTKIRLEIENPRLTLKADPGTVITEIQTTANGRLFLSEQFALPEGQTSLVRLDFADLHLVEQGNGGFTLTPQLRADIDIESADVAAVGEIANIDAGVMTFDLVRDDGTFAVVYTESTSVWLPQDTDGPTGSPDDLADGLVVTVHGIVDVQGVVTAGSIIVATAQT